MPINQKQITFQDLPKEVREILLSEESQEINEMIFQKFRFSDEQIKKFFEIFWDVIFKKIDLKDFLSILKEKLNLDEIKNKELAIDLVGLKFIPLVAYLGVDVNTYLKQLGGNPEEYKKKREDIAKKVKEKIKEEKEEEISESEIESFIRELEDIELKAEKKEPPKEEWAKSQETFLESLEPAQKIDISKIDYLNKILEKIIENTGLFLEDKILKKRFKNIILARLKDVRDKVETKEVLTKPKKIGGLELNEQEVEKVIKVIEDEFKKLDEKIKKEIKVSKFEIPKPVAPIKPPEIKIFKKELKEKFIEEPKKEPVTEISKIQPKPKIAVPVDLSAEALAKAEAPSVSEGRRAEEQPSFAKAMEGKEKKVFKPKFQGFGKPREITRPSAEFPRSGISQGKPPVEDVKPPRKIIFGEGAQPRVMGPLEELRYFTLKDFRNLSSDSKEAISRIKQKIDLLEQESFAKKVQGIKNWRQSEVYRLYLEIGRESIEKNKKASQIIQERTTQNKPTLSAEEFEAVVDLNKSLRF